MEVEQLEVPVLRSQPREPQPAGAGRPLVQPALAADN